jgi:hypothetical protein
MLTINAAIVTNRHDNIDPACAGVVVDNLDPDPDFAKKCPGAWQGAYLT